MFYKEREFKRAVPVWAEGKAGQINCSVWFEALVPDDTELLRIAGSNDYQIFVNGTFCFYGPARAGRGYYRVDEIPLKDYLVSGKNEIKILASAYNTDNFCFFNDEGFLCAEFEGGGTVFGETGSDAWRACEYTEKVRRTQRYSFQRPFAEVYDYRAFGEAVYLPLQECGKKRFIDREVPYPIFERARFEKIRAIGGAKRGEAVERFYDRAINEAGKGIVGGFAVEELDVCSLWEAQRISLSDNLMSGERLFSESLALKDSYARFELSDEYTGFIKLSLNCKSDTDLYLLFDEILDGSGRVDFTRLGCSNVVLYKLSAGRKYTLITAQPYSLKFLEAVSIGGEICLDGAELVRLDFSPREIVRRPSALADAEINKIYSAAVRTFRQNTVDIFMDCPSRERAGWLCDSFFTSRVEYLLTGKSKVERAFLANFTMESSYYKNIPSGMLPMCYPSDHADGVFIPNWAMWYVLELKEYVQRSGDAAFAQALREKLYLLADYFKGFENSDGLLDSLKGWIFVEWSRSNDLVRDVSYPSNMLYYAFLRTLGELYNDVQLLKKAEKLKAKVREKSLIGVFFCDNSVYDGDSLVLSGECTESCQYYAFFTGVASVETDRELWDTLVNDFGPDRKKSGKYPEIAFSNAFIGNYLRCELLMKNGYREMLDKNVRDYFLGMAELTGTLWEHDDISASCNHGFASHVLLWLDHLGYIE